AAVLRKTTSGLSDRASARIPPGGASVKTVQRRYWFHAASSFMSRTVHRLLHDLLTLARLVVTSRAHLAAENLFVRKQLALYHERHTKPTRPDPLSLDSAHFINLFHTAIRVDQK